MLDLRVVNKQHRLREDPAPVLDDLVAKEATRMKNGCFSHRTTPLTTRLID
jgi:hypothetical protein